MGLPNQSQLNFEIKLRNYKNGTDFITNKAWVFPPVKKFSPKYQWDQVKRDQEMINPEYKTKFNDTIVQKNTNELIHQYDKHGVLQTTMWQCSLRPLKRLNPASKSPTRKKTQVSP